VPLWRRYLAVTLTLSIGVMLSCAAFVVMHIEGQRERQVAFNQLADERARSIEINIRHHLDILLDIQTFYAASHAVERDEFITFVQRTLPRYAGVQALGWVPRVLAVEREGHEKQTRDAGHPDFRITEPTAQGQAVPALQRPQYFPVSYLEPTAGNEALVGLDVAAYPPWLEVVHEARDTGTAIATLQSPFGRGNHTPSHLLVFLPVYGNGLPQATLEERRQNLQGFGVGLFRIEALVENALVVFSHGGIDIALYDASPIPDKLIVYMHASRTRPGTPSRIQTDAQVQSGLRYVRTFAAAGHQWSILCTLAPQFFVLMPIYESWGAFAGGLSCTGLVVVYFFYSMGRKARIEQLVAQRTTQLSAANADLEHEITERQRAEEAFRESELRFRQLAEHIHEIFYLFEVESEQMLYISPAYEQIWGRSERALYQQATDFIEAVHPDDRPGVYTMLDQHTRGENSTIEYRIVRPNGEVRWILDRSFPFRDSIRNVYRVAGIAEDITERKQAEEALRQMNDVLEQRVAERTAALSAANIELAKATRLKDEFLASMSHELRTPLNAILGLSEALQEQVYGPLTDKQGQSLRRIEESGRHLLALITDILDLSKIEAGKVALNVTPVDVEGVCQASLRLIHESAQKKQLHVTSRVDLAVSTLAADERRLKQMVVNLLSNAVKFTPAGGSIGLEVTAHPHEQEVDFTVWDTGIGIAEADMERLFRPFVQLDSSLARHHAGTGLGLSLVARLAALHGGRVTLESTVGQGSRFSIVMPWRVTTQDRGPERRQDEHESLLPSLSPSLPMVRLEHVLIAEDTPAHAEQLVRYLQELAVNTIVFPLGEGVVDYVLAIQPDVILLDLALPHGSGWDVLAQLKTEPQTRAIPVVIVSVIDEPAQGLAQGAAAYLAKPISREQLQTALRQAIPRQQWPSPAAAGPQTAAPDSGPLLLLADDNEMHVTTVAEYLHAHGYRLAVAGNGAEALERARALRPSLILMDIHMPGMDGLEAIRRLRAETDPALAATRIIALTALAMPGDCEQCLAAGANAYLSKPYRLHALRQAIEGQLQG